MDGSLPVLAIYLGFLYENIYYKSKARSFLAISHYLFIVQKVLLRFYYIKSFVIHVFEIFGCPRAFLCKIRNFVIKLCSFYHEVKRKRNMKSISHPKFLHFKGIFKFWMHENWHHFKCSSESQNLVFFMRETHVIFVHFFMLYVVYYEYTDFCLE